MFFNLKKSKEKSKYQLYNINSPLRNNFIASKEEMIVFEDGDVVRYYTYSIYPFENIDGKPLFNCYGQKIYNDAKEGLE